MLDENGNAPGYSTVRNCYNTGTYYASSNDASSPLLGAGRTCEFYNCFSLNYGMNPNCLDTVKLYGTKFLDQTTLKSYASNLSANYKTAVRK